MKKVLCTVLAAALACGLCGCNKDEGESSNVPISEPNVTENENVSQSGEQSAENSTEKSDETSAVVIKPEIEMDGQLITLPCKVKDIKGITIDREYSFGVVPASENVGVRSTAFFYYYGVRAGGIILEGDCSEKTVLDEETVVGLYLYDRIPISYLGLTVESDRDDIIKVLGKPDKASDAALRYDIDGNPGDYIIIDLNSHGKIVEIGIYLGFA